MHHLLGRFFRDRSTGLLLDPWVRYFRLVEELSNGIDYNEDSAELEEVLSKLARPGDFYAQGAVVSPLPRLEINEVGIISFPLHPAQAQEIAEVSSPAPYGRGEQTIVDPSVRRVRQLGTDQFRIGGAAWPETLRSIVTRAAESMGCDAEEVEAEMYKLLLYERDGFFLEHRDTEKTPGMFGTLVVVFPSMHSGGELIIRHAGREAVVDFSTSDVSEIGYAAFYADCQHEVKPITQGNRLCLIYNLLQKGQRDSSAAKAPENTAAVNKAAELLTKSLHPSGSPAKIIYLLEHDYTPEGLCFGGLKNHDRAVGAVLSRAAAQAGCVAHLGIVHIEQTGPAEVAYHPRSRGWRRYSDEDDDVSEGEDYEAIEISESAQYISNWVTVEDKKANLPEIPLAENELLPNGALDDEPPDTDRVTEATGNEGATFERSYRRAVLGVWRKDQQHAVLLQNSVDAVMPYFVELAQNGAEAPERLHEIAVQIIDRWASGNRGFRSFLLSEDEKASHADMLDTLRQMGAKDLVEQFIREVVIEHYEGSENTALAKCGSILNPKRWTRLLQELFERYAPFQPGACIALFRAALRQKNAILAEPLADTLLTAFRKPWDAQSEDGYYWNKPKPQKFSATDLSALFASFRKIGEGQLNALANVIVTNPTRFPPDDLIPPALKEIVPDAGTFGQSAVTSLWLQAADFLLARSEHPPVKPTDWARPLKLECKCADCRELERFAADPVEQLHRFKMREDRRYHIESTIRQNGMDMACRTEEGGSPKTLVCTKNLATYERQCARYQKDVNWMKTILDLIEDENSEINARRDRMRTAISR